MDITTVTDDLVVMHDGVSVHRFEGLDSGTDLEFFGLPVRTLDRPAGELLCRFATVNDVHFGEQECGRIDDDPRGPIQRSAPGERPYPEIMNRARELIPSSPRSRIVIEPRSDRDCTSCVAITTRISVSTCTTTTCGSNCRASRSR
jgi:hypothetical protein